MLHCCVCVPDYAKLCGNGWLLEMHSSQTSIIQHCYAGKYSIDVAMCQANILECFVNICFVHNSESSGLTGFLFTKTFISTCMHTKERSKDSDVEMKDSSTLIDLHMFILQHDKRNFDICLLLTFASASEWNYRNSVTYLYQYPGRVYFLKFIWMIHSINSLFVYQKRRWASSIRKNHDGHCKHYNIFS